jgi:hypothetical protein
MRTPFCTSFITQSSTSTSFVVVMVAPPSTACAPLKNTNALYVVFSVAS